MSSPKSAATNSLEQAHHAGHPMDNIGEFYQQRLPPLVLASFTGSLTVAVLVNTTTDIWTAPVYGTPLVATAVGFHAYRKRQDAANLTAAFNAQTDLQSHFSQPIEVRRRTMVDKKSGVQSGKSMAVRWYGFDAGYHDDDFDPVSQLPEFTALVSLANEPKNRIGQLDISNAILKSLPADSSKDFTKSRFTGNVRSKLIGGPAPIIDGYADDAISLTPKQAVLLLKKLEATKPQSQLDYLLTVLTAEQPNHLVAKGASKKLPPASLKRLVQRSIEDRYNQEPSIVSVKTPEGYSRPAKTHGTHFLDGNRLISHSTIAETSGTAAGSVDSRQYGGDQTIDELVAELDRLPTGTKKTELLERALWTVLQAPDIADTRNRVTSKQPINQAAVHDALALRMQAQPQPSGKRAARQFVTGAAAETVGIRYNRPFMRTRAIGTLVAIGVSGLAAVLGANSAHDNAKSYSDTVLNKLGAEGKIETGQESQTVLDNYLAAHPSLKNTSLRAFTRAQNVDGTIHTALNHMVHSIGIPALSSDQQAGATPNATNLYGSNGVVGLGDVDPKSNILQWRISRQSGMPSTGYWASQTTDDLEFSTLRGRIYGDGEPILGNSAYVQKSEPILPYTAAPIHGPLLRVSGQVAVDQGLNLGLDTKSDLGIQLPVLEHTIPFAASATLYTSDGKLRTDNVPLKLINLNDGTYELVAANAAEHSTDHLSLRYALIPSRVLPAHATSDSTIRAVNIYNTSHGEISDVRTGFIKDLPDVERQRIWHSMPGLASQPLPNTVTTIAKGVRNSHTYSFTPVLDALHRSIAINPAQKSAVQDAAEVGKIVASLPSQNCNLAGLTTLLLASKLEPLTPVVGFHQQAEDGVLSSGESHMFVADRAGTVIDATPIIAKKALEPLPESADHAVKVSLHALEVGGLGLAGFGLLIGGVVTVQRFPRWRQKRLQQLATTSLVPKDLTDVLSNPDLPKPLAEKSQFSTAELSYNAHLLSWILYAPQKATLDFTSLSLDKRLETTEDFNRKYRALPRWTPERFTERLAEREAAGLHLPKQQRQQLEQFYTLLQNLPLL